MIQFEQHTLSLVSASILAFGILLFFFEALFDRSGRYLVLALNLALAFVWIGAFDGYLGLDLDAELVTYGERYATVYATTFFICTYLFSYEILFDREEHYHWLRKVSRSIITIIALTLLSVSFTNLRELVILHWAIITSAPFITILYGVHTWKKTNTKLGYMIGIHSVLLFFYASQTVGFLLPNLIPKAASEIYFLWLVGLCFHHIAWIRIGHPSTKEPLGESAKLSVLALEKEVLRRTNDLQVERENAERMAALQLDFLATMSHELRTPLASVVGLCRMLANDENLLLRVRKDMGTIERLSVHLLRMVDDGLAYVRQRGKDEPVAQKPVNMRCLLRDLESIARWLSQHQGNDFTLLQVRGVPQVLHFDEKRLRQILINLISNAGRYCQGGNISLSVKFKMQGKDGVLLWSIQDTGRGMTAQEMNRIFEPFVKSRDSEGLGLGLAVVKRLSAEMGGAVQVKSQLGVGTHFYLSIPVIVEGDNIKEMQLERAVSGRRHFSASRPMTLLTDDEISHLQLSKLRAYLRFGQLSEIDEWLSTMEKSSGLSTEASRFLKMVKEAVIDIDFSAIEALVDQVDSPLS